MTLKRCIPGLTLLYCAAVAALAAVPEDEWKIKRESTFEFAGAPSLQRSGDQVTIRFETRSFCDVAVAIEDANGRIIRYLASGVLGPNAPEPLQKNSKVQELLWDGKDEQGHYIDYKEQCSVRISLGLRAKFEKNLLWEPRRRIGAGQGIGVGLGNNLPVPLLAACPEGVLVAEGHGVDHIRLFDHSGNYVRTVYPFPADKVNSIPDVKKATFPNDGAVLPQKDGFLRSSLLTSGMTGQRQTYAGAMYGTAATAMAINGTRVALTHHSVNRITTDGSTGGMALNGPDVGQKIQLRGPNRSGKDSNALAFPNSLAFSPDGKTLYMAGFQVRDGVPGRNLVKDCLQFVMKLDFESDKPPAVFAGTMADTPKPGSDNNSFKDPTSVAVDKEGRVYVSDFGNDRLQVYEPSGKLLKSIKASKPARVFVHPKTGEIYVCSWLIMNNSVTGKDVLTVAKPTVTKLKSFEQPTVVQTLDLPIEAAGTFSNAAVWGGLEHQVAVDFYSEPVRYWVCSSNIAYWMASAGKSDEPGGSFGAAEQASESWDRKNVRIYEEKGGKLALVRDFGEDVKKVLARAAPPYFWRQRMYVNELTGKLYVGEGNKTRMYKAFHQLIEIDPEAGSNKIVELPLSAEDAAFDFDGLLYLKNHNAVTRWEMPTFREVPFDYGEEMNGVGLAPDAGGRRANVKGALAQMVPPYVSLWHGGGFWVSPKGNIVVPGMIKKEEDLPPELGFNAISYRKDEQMVSGAGVYCPQLFPGRKRVTEVHVFDRKGKMLYEDAIPGIRKMFSICMDRDDNLYALAAGARVMSDNKVFEPLTSTLVKFKPKVARVMVPGRDATNNPPIPLTEMDTPRRNHELRYGTNGEWIDNYEWMYGGLIFSGKSDTDTGGGCSCWNGSFRLDLFGRSFAPETNHYSVAVLDSAGNLIMRIGRYGNADSAGPKSAKPLGGDEVGLFHAQYVGVHTDRRLFVADAGNARIISVALDYHANTKLPIGK